MSKEPECLHCRILKILDDEYAGGDAQEILYFLMKVAGEVIDAAPDAETKAMAMVDAVRALGEFSGANLHIEEEHQKVH